jgi:elongation factor 1-gamma
MSVKLLYFAFPFNMRALRIDAVASFAGVPLEHQKLEYGKDNETPEFMRNCHPLGRQPVLQTDEGYLFESNAIARYIARLDKSNAFLYGRTPFENSQVDMWLDFAATELDATSYVYVMNLARAVPVTQEQQDKVAEVLTGLENWLENRTFLVGERLTVADIVIGFSLQWVFVYNIINADELSKKFKNVFRLFNTVLQQPKSVEVLKAHGSTFTVAKKPEAPKAEKKAEEPKAKKEEKKPADDEDEEEVVVEKKKPNPLDSLPPSPFVLDAFKREYSNTDTRTVAAPYFFNNFDKDGFCAFWCKYKYNEDNKMQFMTANFIRGWFQRMEHTRKYAFGIALIAGEEKKHEVSGLWVFRGKGLPEIVLDVEDTELFEWTEIADINAEKEKITDYLCWEGPTIGLPVLEGRCFK